MQGLHDAANQAAAAGVDGTILLGLGKREGNNDNEARGGTSNNECALSLAVSNSRLSFRADWNCIFRSIVLRDLSIKVSSPEHEQVLFVTLCCDVMSLG